jgi:hypothetical protein
MSTHQLPAHDTSRCLAYASGLHRYAANRLDDVSLRCWIIQRLMLDEGIDHAAADAIFERVIEEARRDGQRRRRHAPRVRHLPRRGTRRIARRHASARP